MAWRGAAMVGVQRCKAVHGEARRGDGRGTAAEAAHDGARRVGTRSGCSDPAAPTQRRNPTPPSYLSCSDLAVVESSDPQIMSLTLSDVVAAAQISDVNISDPIGPATRQVATPARAATTWCSSKTVCRVLVLHSVNYLSCA